MLGCDAIALLAKNSFPLAEVAKQFQQHTESQIMA